MHLKIVRIGDPVPISDLLPILENFGLRVIAERPYELAWPEGGAAWIQDFELEHRDGLAIDIGRIEQRFKEALEMTWIGDAENDGFNRLLLGADLTAREIIVLRAYCRYLLQTGVPFSQAYMERALAANPAIAAGLVRLFEARLDPAAQPAAGRRGRARANASEEIVAQINASLDSVTSLDEDRILRAYLGLVQATLRTNFYRRDPAGAALSYLSFKLDPAAVADLPLPRPKFEIFVYSPRVEGVHLRMGYVARGGIRWSDRREDFRTEVLGLMKAQNVKNTLIVPVGAKGGFVPKRLPGGGREEIQAEVIACYRTFICGLLDLTDNIVGGKVVPPPQVVRRDGDDAYLVVAADKGTATFSDIANSIAADYGFWMGDAFASGGSAGYDHKKLGITARGGWECVKRHFRELGVDIQKTPFTATGIGDMSGDVFGNGMLLSPHIRLQAAFDHRHIFIDPTPDAAVSFAERQRLFELPRSSWDDYDRGRISKGGGVFARSAKSITLSAEARALLGLEVGHAAARRDHAGNPAYAGGPAVERRYRHLRQGQPGNERRGRRPRQRRAAHQRPGAQGQGGRRGRQSRLHATRAHRVCPRRRPPQHRFHRQLRRRQHLRRRGQSQDPAQPDRAGGRPQPPASATGCSPACRARSARSCCATTICRARRSARSSCRRAPGCRNSSI